MKQLHFGGVVQRLKLSRKIVHNWTDWLKLMALVLDGRLRFLKRKTRFRISPSVLGGASVICRSGTTDLGVFWGAFRDHYQLPEQALVAPQVIVDLGANVGYTAASFAALYPTSRVYAVELEPENHGLAVENTRAFGTRCEIIHGAVSAEEGELFYGGEKEDAFHLISLGGPVPVNARKVRAFGMTTLVRELQLSKIDFLKMDIEGAERGVFAAECDWLSVVRALQVEFHAPGMFAPICATLVRHGFECRRDNRHWAAIMAIRKQRGAEG